MNERTRLTVRELLERLCGPCFMARQPLVLMSVATLFDVAAGKHFDGFPLPLPELCRGVWEAEVGSSGELVAFGGFDDAACGCHGGEAFVEGGGSHPTNGAQIGEWLRLGGVGEGCDDAVVDGARLGG